MRRKHQLFHRVITPLQVRDTYKRIPKVDFLFCCTDADKADNFRGRLFARTIDPFQLELNAAQFECASLGHPFSFVHGEQAWSFTYTANRALTFAFVMDRMLRVFRRQPQFVQEFYERLLARTQPRALFVMNNFSSICQAAQKLQIPVVEVLHGRGYTDVFSYWKIRKDDELPTHIISFDEVSTKTYKNFRDGLFQVNQLTDPWNQELINRLLPEDPSSYARPPIPKKPTVLYTLSWGYAGDHGPYDHLRGLIPNGFIPESVIDALKKSKESVNWKFRLHPVQLRRMGVNTGIDEIMTHLIGGYTNAEWEKASAEPLPTLLNEITHHISMASMTSYEAAERGIPSLLLSPTLLPGGVDETLFEDLRSIGAVKVAEYNSDQILSWVRQKKIELNPIKQTEPPDYESIVDYVNEKFPRDRLPSGLTTSSQRVK